MGLKKFLAKRFTRFSSKKQPASDKPLQSMTKYEHVSSFQEDEDHLFLSHKYTNDTGCFLDNYLPDRSTPGFSVDVYLGPVHIVDLDNYTPPTVTVQDKQTEKTVPVKACRRKVKVSRNISMDEICWQLAQETMFKRKYF